MPRIQTSEHTASGPLPIMGIEPLTIRIPVAAAPLSPGARATFRQNLAELRTASPGLDEGIYQLAAQLIVALKGNRVTPATFVAHAIGLFPDSRDSKLPPTSVCVLANALATTPELQQFADEVFDLMRNRGLLAASRIAPADGEQELSVPSPKVVLDPFVKELFDALEEVKLPEPLRDRIRTHRISAHDALRSEPSQVPIPQMVALKKTLASSKGRGSTQTLATCGEIFATNILSMTAVEFAAAGVWLARSSLPKLKWDEIIRLEARIQSAQRAASDQVAGHRAFGNVADSANFILKFANVPIYYADREILERIKKLGEFVATVRP